MGDDDELGLVAQSAHIGGVAADIHIVQRRVDLVQHAEGRGPHPDDGKIQSDGHEGLFSAGKQRDRPHGLARQLHPDLDAAAEDIALILQPQLCAAAACPKGIRKLNPVFLAAASLKMKDLLSGRKPNEIFL